MKRIFFCRMLSIDDGEGNIERYPAVSSHTGNWKQWAEIGDLVVGASSFPSLDAVKDDPNVFLFDDLPLGVQWSAMPQARRNEVAATLRDMGFEFNPYPTWNIKQVIESVVHQGSPGFDIERYPDVKDPWG